jgi:hypothetical protein
MDNEPLISALEEVRDELVALRDRLIVADDCRREAKDSGNPQEIQAADQELAAAMLAVNESKERYRKLFELIRKEPAE